MPRKTVRAFSFTKAGIEKLKPPAAGREYWWDEKTPGLTLCVTATGAKTFYVIRRGLAKVSYVRIGGWPEFTVEAARGEAAREVAKLLDGASSTDQRRKVRDAPTLKSIFDEFLKLPAKGKAKRPKSERTIHEYELQFKAYLSDWHHRKLSTITRPEVEKLHNQLGTTSGPYVANRTLALIKALFNAAIQLGYVTSNPASLLTGFEEKSRERFLQPAELPDFWKAVEAEPSEKLRDFFKLALFTGQRRSNVLSMRWADVNLQRGVWDLPKTKTGSHSVPLTGEAVAILKRREQAKGECEFVFPGRHGKEHLKDPMKQWRELLTRAGLKNLRIHDLRRSLGSWQAITGSSLPIIGKTLGHTQSRTTEVYARLHDDPVRASMEQATAAILAAAKPEEEDKAP